MKTKDMPSARARSYAVKVRKKLESLSRQLGCDLKPWHSQDEIQWAFMAGYRHGRKMRGEKTNA